MLFVCCLFVCLLFVCLAWLQSRKFAQEEIEELNTIVAEHQAEDELIEEQQEAIGYGKTTDCKISNPSVHDLR